MQRWLDSRFDRRRLLRGAAALGAAWASRGFAPAWARSGTAGISAELPTLRGPEITLRIGHSTYSVGGRSGHAVTVNGTLPGPLIRLRQGDLARIVVTNTLEVDTSIHWHGVLLPFQMDGVPGVSFPGIPPGATFVYEFPIRHAGTFWYHSHSGLQEAMGHYGPLILDPIDQDPIACDREHVLVLSDWSFMHPHRVMAKLKKSAGYFNFQRLTLAGLLANGDPRESMTAAERRQWRRLRMDPTDIADVTGATYTYLVNGFGPEENWTALFTPGERVRLRIINASAMTVFNLRLPGLPLTVVNADGNNVEPVEVDELQIAVAETYDIVVQPQDSIAYSVIAESVDRSGYARATLAPRLGMAAPVPPLRPRPVLGMADMGHAHVPQDASPAAHAEHGAFAALPQAMTDHAHSTSAPLRTPRMKMRDKSLAPPNMQLGAGVDMIAMEPQDSAARPGLGLRDVTHRVLVYADLVARDPNPDLRPPTRTLEIHLTGNMERFMWSFDGRRYSEVVEPIRLARDERVRFTLVNDTMMQHPIHLHGHFFEVVNGHPGRHPRKHTVNVQPGSKISFDLTADAPGDWAFHCHLLFHMHAGMFNVVTVRPLEEAGS